MAGDRRSNRRGNGVRYLKRLLRARPAEKIVEWEPLYDRSLANGDCPVFVRVYR